MPGTAAMAAAFFSASRVSIIAKVSVEVFASRR
jgi:hypothetical protein